MQGYRFIALILALILSTACSNLPKEHKVITAKEGVITISINEVDDGNAHFFTYKKSRRSINFFIKKDGRGKLSAYFDACYVCFKNKKGYRVEGGNLVCNECGLKFNIAEEAWENKECSPIPLKSMIGSGNLIIRTYDIEKGLKLF